MRRVTFDHVPIALLCGHWEQTKFYFKFENWWLNQEGFVERIKVWWNDFEFYKNQITSSEVRGKVD